MSDNTTVVSTILKVIESEESKERSSADLRVSNEIPIEELLKKRTKDADAKGD